MEKTYYSVAIAPFGVKYSIVLTSWELNEQGEKINFLNKTLLATSIEAALELVKNEL